MLGYKYELEPLEDLDEQDLFLNILHHDKRGGYAVRLLLTPDAQEADKVTVAHYAHRSLTKLGYRSMAANAYISVNTFKTYRRESENFYNLSGIFIDLDCHSYKSEADLDATIERTKARLRKAFEKGEVSAPTMITSTGRGLGLFYVLKSSIANSAKARKSIDYLDQVRAALTAHYQYVLSGRGYLDVDNTVSDHARVCRMPLTMNKSIGRWCRLIHVQYDDEGNVRYYDLKEIAEQNHLFDRVNEIKKELASKKVISLDAYRMPFLTLRTQKLEMLQELRGYECAGCREYMIFAYYNAAKQIYGVEVGLEMTRKFNSRFLLPLAENELIHAANSVDNNTAITGDYAGFYKLPDSWIVEMLDVTPEENRKVRFGSSKRQIERQKIKDDNACKRAERDKEIATYLKEHPDKSQDEAAALFCVSKSTVCRACKKYGVTRYVKSVEPAPTERVLEKEQNIQILSQSPLGVPSSPVAERAQVVPTDGLVQAYLDLYTAATVRRRRARQVPGQIALIFDSSGVALPYDWGQSG